MRSPRAGWAERWDAHYRGRSNDLDAARARQEQALSLAEETGDTELQARRTRIAMSSFCHRLTHPSER